jgi:hypothetical protein
MFSSKAPQKTAVKNGKELVVTTHHSNKDSRVQLQGRAEPHKQRCYLLYTEVIAEINHESNSVTFYSVTIAEINHLSNNVSEKK